MGIICVKNWFSSPWCDTISHVDFHLRFSIFSFLHNFNKNQTLYFFWSNWYDCN
jgi:hypothetical protein